MCPGRKKSVGFECKLHTFIKSFYSLLTTCEFVAGEMSRIVKKFSKVGIGVPVSDFLYRLLHLFVDLCRTGNDPLTLNKLFYRFFRNFYVSHIAGIRRPKGIRLKCAGG